MVFFDEIVYEKLEFAGRNNGSIWVCGRRNFTAELPQPGQEDDIPDNSVISDLIKYSQKYIRSGRVSNGEKESPYISVLVKGRSFRPSTTTGLRFHLSVLFLQRICALLINILVESPQGCSYATAMGLMV